MSGGEESGGFKRATAGIAGAKRVRAGRRKVGGEGRTHRQRARLKGEGEGREGEGDEDRKVNEQLPNYPGAILFIALGVPRNRSAQRLLQNICLPRRGRGHPCSSPLRSRFPPSINVSIVMPTHAVCTKHAQDKPSKTPSAGTRRSLHLLAPAARSMPERQ